MPDEMKRPWAKGPAEYLRSAGDGDPSHRAAPSAATDEQAAQLELTGVSWRSDDIDLSGMREAGTDRARHRFRAAIPTLIWNAAALEGNTYTLPEVRTLLDGVTVSGRTIDEERQVLALSEAYSWIDESVGDGTFALDKPTSDRVHARVARHEAIESGAFRGEGRVTGGGTVQLASGGFVEGVPAAELSGRWESLIDYLDGIDDVRLAALVYNAAATRAQFYFDGNKRTARLMMTGMLMSRGIDAINVPHARRLEYNVALDRLFSTDDATALMSFIASCALAP